LGGIDGGGVHGLLPLLTLFTLLDVVDDDNDDEYSLSVVFTVDDVVFVDDDK
jgi:hypothetical protein